MTRRISLVDISSRRRRLRRLLFWGGIGLGAGLLLVGLVWVVIRSPLFAVQEVQVNGATYVAAEDVRGFLQTHVAQGFIRSLLGSRNILVWPEEIEGDNVHDLPAVTSLHIRKDLLHRKISVTVTERGRAGIWCFEKDGPERCFWFDPNGILFMPAYSAEGNLTPVIHDYARAPLPLGATVLEARFLPNLTSLFSALQLTPLSIKEVRVEDLDREEIVADTYEGPRLLFSLRFPVEGLAAAVNAVERMAKLSALQYIDFRVENKVYYK